MLPSLVALDFDTNNTWIKHWFESFICTHDLIYSHNSMRYLSHFTDKKTEVERRLSSQSDTREVVSDRGHIQIQTF